MNQAEPGVGSHWGLEFVPSILDLPERSSGQKRKPRTVKAANAVAQRSTTIVVAREKGRRASICRERALIMVDMEETY